MMNSGDYEYEITWIFALIYEFFCFDLDNIFVIIEDFNSFFLFWFIIRAHHGVC